MQTLGYFLKNLDLLFFKKKIFEGQKPFLWGHWYPCFGLLVTSPLGFSKPEWSALFALRGGASLNLLVITAKDTYITFVKRCYSTWFFVSVFNLCCRFPLTWNFGNVTMTGTHIISLSLDQIGNIQGLCIASFTFLAKADTYLLFHVARIRLLPVSVSST